MEKDISEILHTCRLTYFGHVYIAWKMTDIYIASVHSEATTRGRPKKKTTNSWTTLQKIVKT